MLVHGLDGSAAVAASTPGGTPVAARPPQKPVAVSLPAADEPSAQEIHAAAVQANRALAALSTTIEFEVDPDTRITVVKLIDSSDQRVLRQVPSREMLEIARALDRVQSLLIHAVA